MTDELGFGQSWKDSLERREMAARRVRMQRLVATAALTVLGVGCVVTLAVLWL